MTNVEQDATDQECIFCKLAFSPAFWSGVLGDHRFTHEADPAAEVEEREREQFDPDPEAPDPILIQGFEPSFRCDGKHFFPFTDAQADEMARFLEQTQETWTGLSATAVEFAQRIHDQLLLYRGRTWFTPRHWACFKAILGVIGWPASVSKADVEVPHDAA